MKLCGLFLFVWLFLNFQTIRAQEKSLISQQDFQFLKQLTKSVLDSSRIAPGQRLPESFGKNNTGSTLIRPGGRDTYPSFWIRDYAMSIETGMISNQEQKHMLLLTASTQCDQTWITKGGSMVPYGAIADHIRVDNSLPVYFPGTYDYEGQGTKEFGMTPPYCDQFYFVQMAYYYVKNTADISILNKEVNGIKLIARLETAFVVPPSGLTNHIVFTNDTFRGVDFGFRDAVDITGELCYPSILKFHAAVQLSEIFDKLKNKSKAAKYKQISDKIEKSLPGIFLNENGMLRASTGKSCQADVWSTAFAIYSGLLKGNDLNKACQYLANAYKSGTLAYKGSIRHILTTEDFSSNTAWESSIADKNTYQNGAYWGTPTGWVAYAIAKADPAAAKQLITEYITELRENDFRKGPAFKSPLECFSPENYTRGPVYLTTVSCPYSVLKKDFENQ